VFRTFLSRLRDLLDISSGHGLAPTHVRRLDCAHDRLSGEVTRVERLVDGDCILCVAGDVIPCRGVVVDGSAAVRCSLSKRQFLRGGSPVLPGTTVVANFVVVRVVESA
jgi:high-affinity K+ transport system ATPase subunit B